MFGGQFGSLLGSVVLGGVMEEQEVVYGTSYHPYPKKVVSPYWREKYERDAQLFWDRFYRSNEDKFFKGGFTAVLRFVVTRRDYQIATILKESFLS